MLEEFDNARVQLGETLSLLRLRGIDLDAAEGRKREVERECDRLGSEMRIVSELLADQNECLRLRVVEVQAATFEAAKCNDELKEVELSLAAMYRKYEADRDKEEVIKKRLDLLGSDELNLMENQRKMINSVDKMKSDIADCHHQIAELDDVLESKKKSVEEMKVDERALIVSMDREERKLNSIRESTIEVTLLLAEMQAKVTVTGTDLRSVETDLEDVTSELKVKLDEFEEYQEKCENDEIENRKKVEKCMLEWERVKGMVENEKSMLTALSAKHDAHVKDLCILEKDKISLEKTILKLSKVVDELNGRYSERVSEKEEFEKEFFILQMSRTKVAEDLESLSAIVEGKNTVLKVIELDTESATKKLSKIRNLSVAEERVISHQRLQLKCCLDELLVYETKLQEEAVRVQSSPAASPALGSEHRSGLGSDRILKLRE